MKIKGKYNNDTRRSTLLIWFLLGILVIACVKRKTAKSVEIIVGTGRQDSIFQALMAVTGSAVPEAVRKDSLAFLLLPVEASCPSCRKKTIDSIIERKDQLPINHYIILSANGGRKTISAFFRERGKELPVIANRLFLDSTNQALAYDLADDKPTMYYTAKGRAFKKVAAIPNTVKTDLHEFFSNGSNRIKLSR